ncbi:MAG: isoleucine--tRNA ligase [Clostridia bacterium]|nr:isoleucine--tRNA ligase [Clostridia bacterium]
MDYGKTLNLPKTKFPMRANLPKREPEFVEFWDKNDIYGKSVQKNEGKEKFILHDGPPYANGDIHLGHTLNKILKDIIIKYKTMTGYDSPYIPGWDTHGLPIELQAIKNLDIDRKEISPVEFRKKCKDYALKYMDNQREQFKRLGVRGDWDNPYLTLKPEFEAKQIEVFGEMAKKGYIYKGLKPVYWCPKCETALAEAEIEYDDHETDSIYVKFKVEDDKGLFSDVVSSLDNVYVIIWTTTTWTLPANLAICLGPSFEYSLIETGGEVYLLATELIEHVAKVAGLEEWKVLKKFDGGQLEGIKTKHPFIDRFSPIILGNHVTLEQGTGCVHTAPGHGQEDFEIGMKYGLEVLNPVDDRGYMTEKAGSLQGLYYEESNGVILDQLKKSGALLAITSLTHSYPHCWRCKDPVIFRATEQWFASIDGFRDKAIQAIDSVKWVPAWGQERITNMVKDRYDWCISRQRIWGVPIPIFYCKKCGKELINDQTIKAVSELFGREGSDAWFIYSAEDILPDDIKCECGCDQFEKETDTMDVWFDSGSTHTAVLETTPGQRWPADMYLEGNDQYRGWFQSSLLTSVATRGVAPYKIVLTHGFVVDGQGKKMSKSLGNGIDPLDVIEKYGADILRLWVVSADYRSDMRVSQQILKQLSEVYRKIRNTCRFLLGNLNDFDPDKDRVEYDEMLEIDKWALMKLNSLIDRVTDAYDNYEYHVLYHSIHNFCVVDMSNFYLDIIKDRLYTFKSLSKERRAAQTAMYDILVSLVKLIAPVLTFTSEEIWQHMPKSKDQSDISVQLADWPKSQDKYIDSELEKKWDNIIKVRDEVSKALEKARNQKVIGHSLNAKVDIYADGEVYEFLGKIKDHLNTIFIVSEVDLHQYAQVDRDGLFVSDEIKNFEVGVSQATGKKCERCWNFDGSVGKDDQYPDICERCIQNIK